MPRPKKVKKETTKEIVKTPPPQETVWSYEQISLIKNTVAKGATDDELKLFLYTAKRTGLDPLTKQIHFVKRGGSMTIQTGIDGYRAIAERTGQLAGIEDAKYELGDTELPIKATVTIYRVVKGLRVPFEASARWNEYVPKGGSFMWQKMPFLMLGKVAEALALRKAFPMNLSGLYTNEEMQQAETPTNSVVVPEEIIKADDFLPKENVIYDKPKEPEKKELDTRSKIAHLCKILNIDLYASDLKDRIKALTSLELDDEDNHLEIINRLEMIVRERKEAENK